MTLLVTWMLLAWWLAQIAKLLESQWDLKSRLGVYFVCVRAKEFQNFRTFENVQQNISETFVCYPPLIRE